MWIEVGSWANKPIAEHPYKKVNKGICSEGMYNIFVSYIEGDISDYWTDVIYTKAVVVEQKLFTKKGVVVLRK